MLRVCTETVYEFGDIWHRQAKERAWREFSALASHRIGNEVSTIGMLLDDLREELAAVHDWESWTERLCVADNCVNRAKRMLREQAILTAEIRPDHKRVSLTDVLKRAVAGVLPKGSILRLQEAAAHTTDIWIDPDLMEEAFRELCFNAVRAVQGKLELTIEITASSGETLISFEDNGPGVAPQDAERMFTPYVVLRKQGTGLGLATVRRIVQAHGGRIWLAESKRGAKFMIALPMNSEKE
jgi:signal transduction histidine kinase